MNTSANTAPIADAAAATVGAKPAAAASSSRIRAFALTFSALAPLAYCFIQYLNLPLVT
jgi:hypothetical protein